MCGAECLQPALALCEQVECSRALTKAAIYDALVQVWQRGHTWGGQGWMGCAAALPLRARMA